MNHDEVARLLGAYLDGELDLTTCLSLEEHIAGCEACQQKMAAEQEFIEAVRLETPRFEPSPFLKTRIQATLREQSATPASSFWKIISPFGRFSRGGIAFLVLCLIAMFAVYWWGTPSLIQDAIADHVRSLQVSHLMDVASTDQHTVKPWFAGKLDYSPPVADLAPSGYPLIGGRLDVLDDRNVAALIYQRRKHYINLFIWPEGAHALTGHFYSRRGYHALGWTRDGMNYLAVSELGEAEFMDFVKLIQDKTVETRPGE
jgi:anti-sigma factor RsiW